MSKVMIPAFILAALQQCLESKVVPSIRQGEGGNSHSVWFISFTVFDGRKLHDFEVKVTSSYSQQFLDFCCYSGAGFDGLIERRTMADCVALAKANVAALAA